MTTRRHGEVPTPLGDLLAVLEADALVGLYFPAHQYPPAAADVGPSAGPDDEVLRRLGAELGEYFSGSRTTFGVRVATSGDAFSEQVWAMLREIPYGTTTTYGALARRLGSVGLAQRVGQAVGHNPVSILVPCHRVVGSDGSLTGYAGGLERKRALLALEEPPAQDAGRLW